MLDRKEQKRGAILPYAALFLFAIALAVLFRIWLHKGNEASAKIVRPKLSSEKVQTQVQPAKSPLPLLLTLNLPQRSKNGHKQKAAQLPPTSQTTSDRDRQRTPHQRWLQNLEREKQLVPTVKPRKLSEIDEDWKLRVATAQGVPVEKLELTFPSSTDGVETNDAAIDKTADPATDENYGGIRYITPTSSTTETGASTTEPTDTTIDATTLLVKSSQSRLNDPFTAAEVEDFFPGSTFAGGFIRKPEGDLNQIVSGPPDFGRLPDSAAASQPSQSILSLGIGGSLNYKVAEGGMLFDEAGVDLVVFENPFLISDPEWREILGGDFFAETGEVAVWGMGPDGVGWYTFPCDYIDTAGGYPGCAGRNLVLYDPPNQNPLSYGGDAFDLKEIGVSWATKISVSDRGGNLLPEPLRGPGKEGFDLDSIALLHAYSATTTEKE